MQQLQICSSFVNQESRRGLSLVEVAVSTLLVGLLVISAMRSMAGSAQSGETAASRTIGTLLAENLMQEILQQDYLDPDETVVFGIESSEESNDRSTWDDVDDYDDWTASPPTNRNSATVADDSWTRSVVVEHVESTDLESVQSDSEDTGVKRITVTVSRNGEAVAALTSIQTSAWISMIPEAGSATTTGQLPPENEPPTAAFTQDTTSGIGNVSVEFNASSSSDPEDHPLEYSWTFGDGSGGSGDLVTHVFTNFGSETVVFTVTLTVQDIHGSTDTTTTNVTVYANP